MCKILIKQNNQFYYAFIKHFETFIPTTLKKIVLGKAKFVTITS
jgi:hypothetical protein